MTKKKKAKADSHKEEERPRKGEDEPRAPGMPDEASIVEVKTFTSPKGNRYRILRTNETDPYDEPAEESRARRLTLKRLNITIEEDFMPRSGRRGRGAGRSMHAKPPHDNPLLRQQDRLLARLSSTEEERTAHSEANRRTTPAAALSAFAAPRARARRGGTRAAPRTAAVDGAEMRLEALRTSRAMPHNDVRGMGVAAAVVLGSNNWVQLGPTAIPGGQASSKAHVMVTGRVTSICIDPTNPQTIYVGAARGGIWKSTDGGKSWTAKSDNEVSLATGALAVARSNPQVIYAGTGEGNLERYVQAFPLELVARQLPGQRRAQIYQRGRLVGAAGCRHANGRGLLPHSSTPDQSRCGLCRDQQRALPNHRRRHQLEHAHKRLTGYLQQCDRRLRRGNRSGEPE